MICIYIYYSAIENKEILLFGTIRVDLEGIMLGEISQTEKDKYCMILCLESHQPTNKTTKFIEKGIRFVVTRGEGLEKEGIGRRQSKV